MRTTTPVDRLLLGFLAAVAALAATFVPIAWPVLTTVAAMAMCILATARLRDRAPFLSVVHGFIPVPVLALLLNVVGPVVEHVNPTRWDATLSRIDARFFGPLIGAWMNAGGRPGWLVDAASVAYASHYLLPVAAGAVLWANHRSDEFDRFAFSITAVLLGSYVVFFLVPAAGPRVPDDLAQAARRGRHQRRVASVPGSFRTQRARRVPQRPHCGLARLPRRGMDAVSTRPRAPPSRRRSDRILDRVPVAALPGRRARRSRARDAGARPVALGPSDAGRLASRRSGFTLDLVPLRSDGRVAERPAEVYSQQSWSSRGTS